MCAQRLQPKYREAGDKSSCRPGSKSGFFPGKRLKPRVFVTHNMSSPDLEMYSSVPIKDMGRRGPAVDEV
jgi:hypothetical protein